jgi:hypothetical protein
LKMVHSGVILVRLESFKSPIRAQMVFDFIQKNQALLFGSFIVLQPGNARIRQIL